MTDFAEDSDWSFGDHVPEGEATPPQPAVDPGAYEEGALFGGCYEITGRLGRGGMGVVYRALDRTSRREVAIKLLTQTLDSRSRERFRREGELTASLSHPGIVRVHAGGELNKTPYLVYELVEGSQTLVGLMKERDRDTLVQTLCRVADAMAYAHQRGVVHRDLKPENVLIDAEGNPKVADFGLARAVGDSHLTRTGSLVGTPAFMSPEQVMGEHDRVGPHSDVWALGVMLYNALTGTLPFRAATFPELSVAIVEQQPDAPRAVDPTTPPALEAVCLKALRKRPEGRYPDAGAFAADLRRALENQSVSTDSLPERLVVWTRAQRVPIAVTGVVVGLILAGVLVPALEPEVTVTAGKRDAEAESAQGRALAKQGRHSEAAQAFARALAAGAPVEVTFEQARAHWQAGELERAEEACRAYLTTRRDSAGLALLARVLLARGQVGFAERTAEDLAREYPGPSAEVVRAEVALGLGRDPKPILRAALKAWPASADVRLELARRHLMSLEAHEARGLVDGAGEEAASLRDLIEALLAQPPDTSRLRAAPPRLAVACARWLLAEGTRDVVFSRRPPAEGALDLAVRRARARAALEAVLTLSENERAVGRAHLWLGVLARLESRDAWDHAQRACAALPREPRALRLRAEVQLARGHPARALADLDAASSLDGTEPGDAALLRARAIFAGGGVPASSSALEAQPEQAAALLTAARAAGREAWASALEVRLAERDERRRQARELFERLRLVGPMTPEICRQALSLDPGYSRARLALGTERFLRGEHQGGIRDSLVAVERDPVSLSELLGQMLTVAWASEGLFGSRTIADIVGGPDAAPRGDAAALFLLALAAEFEGKSAWVAPALARLSERIERDPARLWPRVLRALLRARQGRLDEADHDLRVVLEVEPALGIGWFGKAVVEVRRGSGSVVVRRHIAQAQRMGFLLEQHRELLAVAYPLLVPHVGPR